MPRSSKHLRCGILFFCLFFLHCAVSIFLLLSWLSSADAPFGAVTQLVGSQEGHLARKKLDVGYNIT